MLDSVDLGLVFVPILLGAIALGGAFGAGSAVVDHLEKGGVTHRLFVPNGSINEIPIKP